MATPKWVAGTLYPTGSLVQPLTGGGATSTAITNPGFESGTTDWTLGPSMATDTANPFAGVNALRCTGTAGWNEVVHDESPVNPGQSITATCMYQQGGASTNQNTGMVFLRWYTAAMALISDSDGNLIVATEGDHYKQSSVTAVAPSGAAFVSIGGKTNRTNSPDSRFDNFAWNYAAAVAPPGLIFKAVQPTLGTSAATEPAWPASVGLTVVDNTVIWEALVATRVTYEASPILVSGAVEPSWPESIGDFVADGTISWEAVPQQVIQAPQSKVVTIASSKVYAADGDIVRYCATVNPLDWTSADDAGYLPTGLNQYGSNRTAVLNTYRGNVVPFSASTFLCYQADPDPANITQLDAMEGIGSTYQQAAHPVANDLFYLSPLGVRTVGIAAGTSNLAAGDAGAPIDPLVQAALLPAGVRPLGAYYPNQGQYWLCMRPPLPVVEGPTITGDAPDGFLLEEYTPFQYTITLGDAPLNSVYVSDGSLPPGLSLSDTGIITGTPTSIVGSPFDFTVTAEDENGLTDAVEDTIAITSAMLLIASTTSNGVVAIPSNGGIDWSANPISTETTAPDLQYGLVLSSLPGRYWGKGYASATPAAYSDDLGVTWTATAGNVVRGPGQAYTNGKLFLGAHEANYLVSNDEGETFSAGSNKGKFFVARNTEDGDLACALTDLFVPVLIESTDTGTTWSSGVDSTVSTAGGGCSGTDGVRYYFGGSTSNTGGTPKLVRFASGVVTNITMPTFASATNLISFAYGNNIKVVGATSGELAFDNGSGFQLSTTTFSGPVIQILWNGKVFVALEGGTVPGDTGAVYYSYDGDTFTAAPTYAPLLPYSVAQAIIA